MRKYILQDDKLIMIYTLESWTPEDFYEHVSKREDNGNEYLYHGTFKIYTKNIIKSEGDDIYIKIGEKHGNYVYLDKDVFIIDYDFAFASSIKLSDKLFLCSGNSATSIIRSISTVANNSVFVDDEDMFKEREGHIKFADYLDIIEKFPNYTELTKYKKKVISALLQEFFDKMPNYNEAYEKFIKRHRKMDFATNIESNNQIYNQSQIFLFEGIKQKLNKMLNDDFISESQWQVEIAKILLLIYPKYLHILPKIQFTSLGEKRELDYIAVDNEGNLDIIEIKKASIGSLLRKHPYRNNYIPTKELEGSIVQCEKYLYLLKSNKSNIESTLNTKYSSILNNITIKIINPQAIVIAGRSDTDTAEEKKDFEIIRRMHKNVIEILTYDNLITRLDNTIECLKANIEKVPIE